MTTEQGTGIGRELWTPRGCRAHRAGGVSAGARVPLPSCPDPGRGLRVAAQAGATIAASRGRRGPAGACIRTTATTWRRCWRTTSSGRTTSRARSSTWRWPPDTLDRDSRATRPSTSHGGRWPMPADDSIDVPGRRLRAELAPAAGRGGCRLRAARREPSALLEAVIADGEALDDPALVRTAYLEIGVSRTLSGEQYGSSPDLAHGPRPRHRAGRSQRLTRADRHGPAETGQAKYASSEFGEAIDLMERGHPGAHRCRPVLPGASIGAWHSWASPTATSATTTRPWPGPTVRTSWAC